MKLSDQGEDVMGVKITISEEKFIKTHYLTDIYARAKEIDPTLWNMLQEIETHYSEYSKYCEAIVQKEIVEILKDSETKGIHSARFRVKKLDSLLVKIVKKKAFLSKEVQDDYDIEKYRDLDASNYYKIITDISGIRILIRYREQWRQVHEWIWKRYYKGDEWYLHDFVKDYKTNEGKAFIAEKPKVYYRNQQDRMFYEEIGKDIFDFRLSDEGYNSMHYLVNVDGKYIEIQMRTLLDEAWGECTHDIVYKGTSKAQLPELQYLSQCLAQQTIAAETITNLIYEKVNKKGMIFRGTKTSKNKTKVSPQQSEKKCSGNSVETRMRLLEKNTDDEFDGNVDSLL
jgi:ppGpp synthetase/RelA/SpoT-type nucleotidyltranferase